MKNEIELTDDELSAVMASMEIAIAVTKIRGLDEDKEALAEVEELYNKIRGEFF